MKRQLVVVLFTVAIAGCGSETNNTPPASPVATSEPAQARSFERDSDAERILEHLDFSPAFVFNYQGGFLIAAIYQTDGKEIIYSSTNWTEVANVSGWKPFDFMGQLIVVVTEGNDVKVVSEFRSVTSTGGTSTYMTLQLDAELRGKKKEIIGNADGVTIKYDDRLFMEVRWLEQWLEGVDAETKNRVWWDYERRGDEIVKLFSERADGGNGTNALMAECKREVDRRILERNGVNSLQAGLILQEGETAAWRTETPPVTEEEDIEAETPPSESPTPE